MEPVQTAPTQDLSDQGMPSIAERAAETEVSRDGMPQRVSVPKPAPIPEGWIFMLSQNKLLLLLRSQFRVTEEKEQQRMHLLV